MNDHLYIIEMMTRKRWILRVLGYFLVIYMLLLVNFLARIPFSVAYKLLCILFPERLFKNAYESLRNLLKIRVKKNKNLISRWKSCQQLYEEWARSELDTRYVSFIRYLADRFVNFVNPKGLILDIGCGCKQLGGRTYDEVGYDYLKIKKGEDTVIGIDPLVGRSDVVAIGENIPFKNNSFDCVVIVSVLDHVMDPSLVLKESRRVLKNRGKIGILNTTFILPLPPDLYHLHTFTISKLCRMLRKVGFSNIKQESLYINRYSNVTLLSATKRS